MHDMLVADGAKAKKEGRKLGAAQYGPAMKIYADIQKVSKKASNLDLVQILKWLAVERERERKTSEGHRSKYRMGEGNQASDKKGVPGE